MSEKAAVHLYPIALRDGIMAYIQAPDDLTVAEAEKISRVVMALANP